MTWRKSCNMLNWSKIKATWTVCCCVLGEIFMEVSLAKHGVVCRCGKRGRGCLIRKRCVGEVNGDVILAGGIVESRLRGHHWNGKKERVRNERLKKKNCIIYKILKVCGMEGRRAAKKKERKQSERLKNCTIYKIQEACEMEANRIVEKES